MIAIKCDLCGKFEVGSGSIVEIDRPGGCRYSDKICSECLQRFTDLRNKLKKGKK